MRILLAEDEVAMSEAVVDILDYHHYAVDAVYNGADALDYARSQNYDGIILDIMMPRMDGIEVLRRLRSEGNRTPVLLLTAKGEVEDRIRGLDAGADDYLPKPFAMGELLARLRAMLRRRESYVPDVLELGNVALDPARFELRCGGRVQSLSKLEYQIMELLMRNPGMTFSAETLLERVWGCDSDAGVGAVWVYISYLRKKLTALGADVEIASRRGLGYSLEVQR
ncbi:MAG: response regulator transcription factor [Eubacteriales bacterium]|nr:response regulator transcription factor [Eubacteriales bacterium]